MIPLRAFCSYAELRTLVPEEIRCNIIASTWAALSGYLFNIHLKNSLIKFHICSAVWFAINLAPRVSHASFRYTKSLCIQMKSTSTS